MSKQMTEAFGAMTAKEKPLFNVNDIKKKLYHCLIYFLLCGGVIITVVPFLWMLSASLKLDREVFNYPIQWMPQVIRWQNYLDIWKEIDFLTYYRNTIVLTLVVTFNVLLTSSLAAYAFAKINFPERKLLFVLYLMTIAVPFQVTMIPQFAIMRNLGLGDSLLALILLQSFSPFGVFLLRQFYLGIPEELSESARIDGLSDLGIYARIILPLSKPALSSVGIYTFVFVWNDFLGPLIYLTSDENKTIQLGIQKFITQYGTEYGLIMAASVCALFPVVVMFMIFQKNFIQGISTTGLKG